MAGHVRGGTVAAGVPLEQVSVLLGHQSIKVTERHYSPWVKARQEQLETAVRSTFEHHNFATIPDSEIASKTLAIKLWRRGESAHSPALKIRKLLKTQNDKNAEIVENSINWNVSGTWDLAETRVAGFYCVQMSSFIAEKLDII